MYLKKGQSATIRAKGTWSHNGIVFFGPDGHPNKKDRGCQKSELVARINLTYEDTRITCIGESGTVTAHQDGILFIGMIFGSDLGESGYQIRTLAQKYLDVTVISNAATVPLVELPDVTTYPYERIKSGWVELATRSIVVTVPTKLVIQDLKYIAKSLSRLQSFYDSHYNLRRIYPYGSQTNPQPVRFITDPAAPGYMLAGNPIRMDPSLIQLDKLDRITGIGQSDNYKLWWGYAHELGHNFQIQYKLYNYSEFIGFESWPNIFAMHAQRTLKLGERPLDCKTLHYEYTNGGFNTPDAKKKRNWFGLCFLMHFYDEYGYKFYQDFFSILDRKSKVRGNNYDWEMNIKDFSEAAGEDVREVFDTWKLIK